MPTSPKYSFIMPAYKGQFIRESIESILKQTHKDFELIIVDDASPDNLCEIVSEYKDSRIRFYRNEHNIGGADLVAQWNHCLEYARGEWVILATDDDVYEPEFLSTADYLLKQYPTVDMYHSRICHCDECLIPFKFEPALPDYASYEEYLYMMYHGVLGGIPQYMFRTRTLRSIGGFYSLPKAHGSDELIALIMAKNGVVCSGKVLTKFRYSGLNVSEGNFSVERLLARFLSYEYTYTNLLPLLRKDDIYTKHLISDLVRMFPYAAKHEILRCFREIPLVQRHKYIHWIWEHTPYLNKRNKYSMIYRLYVKK